MATIEPGGAEFGRPSGAPPGLSRGELAEFVRAIEKCRARLETLAALGDVLADRVARLDTRLGPIDHRVATDLEQAFDRWGAECLRRFDEMQRLRERRPRLRKAGRNASPPS